MHVCTSHIKTKTNWECRVKDLHHIYQLHFALAPIWKLDKYGKKLFLRRELYMHLATPAITIRYPLKSPAKPFPDDFYLTSGQIFSIRYLYA